MKKQFKITDEEIKNLYLNGWSLSDIAKVAQDTKGLMALRNRLHELGVNTNVSQRKYRYKISTSSRKYSFNEHYFDNIESEHQAYWLGFLMSDGYNHESKSQVSLRLHIQDIEILQKFKEDLQYTGEISVINRGNTQYCDLTLCSPIFSEALTRLGCVQGKTYTLEFPKLQDHLLNHFLRGYFDGDGCISITQRSNRKEGSMQYQLNFVGKDSVILKIQDIICKNTGVFKTKLRNRKNSFANCISWCGRKVCFKILQYLYKDSTIYLNRKYNKYLQIGNAVE